MLRRAVLPSMAMTSPSTRSTTVPTHAMKQATNDFDSSSENTLLKVSRDGMPSGRSSPLSSQSYFVLPKSSL